MKEKKRKLSFKKKHKILFAILLFLGIFFVVAFLYGAYLHYVKGLSI